MLVTAVVLVHKEATMSCYAARYLPLFRHSLRATYHNLALLISLLLVLEPVALACALTPWFAQDNARPSAVAQGDKEIRLLESGKPIERELAGGQSHSYQITLTEGQYLNVVVEQRGIDVVVTLRGPDSKKLIEVDSPNGAQGPEPLQWIVEAAGIYRIEVRSLENDAKLGRYEAKIVELRVATSRDRDLAEADKLYNESVSLRGKGQHGQAIPLAERALALREKTLGAEHPDTAASLDNLAGLHRDKGDYAQAEPHYRRALAIREKTLGAEHPRTASSLNNLAELYRNKGDYAQAEPLYRRALAIYEKTLGAEHPLTATALNNLALLYHNKGDYAQAEPLHRRALAIFEKTLGAEHPRTTTALNNLAGLYHDKGDYMQAEPLLRRALAITEKTLGAEHPATAASLGNLAGLYHDKGDYAQAEPLYRRALAIREKTLGPEHPLTATSLNNLAGLYDDKGDYGQAESLYRHALAIREKTLGPEHPDTANSLNNLAGLYDDKGDYGQAESLYRHALAIREKTLGAEHPRTAASLNNHARLHGATGDISRAVALRLRAQVIEERNILVNLVTGSERQKLAYLTTLAGSSDYSVNLHVRSAPANSTARDLALTVILQRKGRVLDSMFDSLGTLRRRFNQQDQALLDQWKETSAYLAILVLGWPQKMPSAERQKQIKALEERKENLEAQISRRSAEFRAQSQPITIEAVQSAIPTNAAVIEFFSYRLLNTKYTKPAEAFGQPRYVVYVLRRHGEPQWVELGEAKVVDDAVAAWRKALRDPNRADVKRLARQADERVMQPVRALLGDTRRVFISPDGTLNLIPFVALVDERNQYLVERYSFSYLTSGRDLLRLQATLAGKPEPVIVADPVFGERAGATLALRREVELRPDPQPSDTQRIGLDRIYFPQLPATAGEAKALKSILPQATVFTREQATEAALKQISSPRILHIATHGFFLEDIETKLADTRDVVLIGDGPTGFGGAQLENPLLRSGLALTGANLRKSGEDDGVLTAMEVAGLDLWGTKLVVLSACDTGVGEVKNGEGVYGLRRALVLAGSETQVMSLWPVSDAGTRDLMIEYYKALQRGEGRGEALRQVQLRMLRSKDRNHPFYWASFIQSGEWANLEGKR
jgi:CHAT domain-containing protein/Tfp pilus assembly protein PilF